MSTPYALVVPVKTLVHAKSRLRGFTDAVRRELMCAFALDAVGAALDCPLVSCVHVVTDDPDLADTVRGLGCAVHRDRGGGDLNTALRAAVGELAARPVAAMLGDLPCLVVEDLTAALAAVSGSGFVADAGGTGTTLLAVSSPAGFDPRFGVASRDAHLAAGVPEVTLAVSTLRHDVDTAEDLEQAVARGVGPRTRAVLAAQQPRGS